ncbi:Cytochrome P450 724B1 [Linum grandiflorum]
MGWPFIGQTLAFLKPHRSNSIGSFLQQNCTRYGKVFRSHLFGSPAIVSCDYEFNMFVLQNEGKLFEASYPKAMHGILGEFSLLMASGELHKRLRGVPVTFATRSRSSPKFHAYTQNIAYSLMDSWKGKNEISFLEEMKKFTLSLMVKTVLSIDPKEAISKIILDEFRKYMKGFISLPLNIPGSPYAKAVKARARLSKVVKGIIKERERMRKRRQYEEEEEEGDFLDEILSKQSSMRNMKDEEIVSSVLDILMGGYETTSTLISIAVYFLHRSPEAFEAFKEEHQGLRRNKLMMKNDAGPGGDHVLLNWDDYQNMNFTHCVAREAVRCGNVVKFLHRKAVQDVEFKGYFIPAGWKVLPILSGPNLDPALHHDHLRFNPWRWMEDKEINKKVMGYGGGARVCPGADLAKVMVAFFLHHLVLSYRWKVKEDDDHPVAYPYVEFRNGLLLEIEPSPFTV